MWSNEWRHTATLRCRVETNCWRDAGNLSTGREWWLFAWSTTKQRIEKEKERKRTSVGDGRHIATDFKNERNIKKFENVKRGIERKIGKEGWLGFIEKVHRTCNHWLLHNKDISPHRCTRL